MKKSNGKSTKKELIDILLDSDGFKGLQSAFDRLLEHPIWWISQKGTSANVKPLLRTQRARGIEDYLSISDHKKAIAKALKAAQKKEGTVLFSHSINNTYGIAVPIVRDSTVYGFFGVCGLKSKPKDALLDIVNGYIEIIINEIYKEFELARLYNLVRPRAIALSTVHTIHRLISSTLDLQELFPRIARLSLQVLKAERANICIIDPDSSNLCCAASVDYTKSKGLFKKKIAASPLEKKVAQTGRNIYRAQILCAPLVDEEICGVITVRDKVGDEKFSIFDQEILTTLAEQAVIAIRNAQLYKEQEDLTIGTIKSLGFLLDAKFPRLYTHTPFFEELMVELGREMGLTRRELRVLHYSALMPDLGKVVMPEEMLKKTKALSGKERKMLKTHTLRGIEILKYLAVLKPVIPIIVHHHEKYNGTGYPDRLKGKRIPLGSRIMAVADSFEAMICHRPYRRPMPFRMAASEIRRQSGKQFDPEVVKAFMHLANEGRLETLIRKHADDLKKVF